MMAQGEEKKYVDVNIFAKCANRVGKRGIAGTEVCGVSEAVLSGNREVIERLCVPSIQHLQVLTHVLFNVKNDPESKVSILEE